MRKSGHKTKLVDKFGSVVVGIANHEVINRKIDRQIDRQTFRHLDELLERRIDEFRNYQIDKEIDLTDR